MFSAINLPTKTVLIKFGKLLAWEQGCQDIRDQVGTCVLSCSSKYHYSLRPPVMTLKSLVMILKTLVMILKTLMMKMVIIMALHLVMLKEN